jgi:V/A-type H+-transporting ATPase subunit K
MKLNMRKTVLMALFAVLTVALVTDVAAAQGEDNASTESAFGKVGAGLALAGCGIGTGLSQGHVGAAAVGMVAEDKSKFGLGLVFMAIPETIVLIGFVALFML